MFGYLSELHFLETSMNIKFENLKVKSSLLSYFTATVLKSVADNEITKGINITITEVNNTDGTNNNGSVNPSITIPYDGLRLAELPGKGIKVSFVCFFLHYR